MYIRRSTALYFFSRTSRRAAHHCIKFTRENMIRFIRKTGPENRTNEVSLQHTPKTHNTSTSLAQSPVNKAHDQDTWPQNRVTTKTKQLRANANPRMARVDVLPTQYASSQWMGRTERPIVFALSCFRDDREWIGTWQYSDNVTAASPHQWGEHLLPKNLSTSASCIHSVKFIVSSGLELLVAKEPNNMLNMATCQVRFQTSRGELNPRATRRLNEKLTTRKILRGFKKSSRFMSGLRSTRFIARLEIGSLRRSAQYRLVS
jgi:hypothetical protein